MKDKSFQDKELGPDNGGIEVGTNLTLLTSIRVSLYKRLAFQFTVADTAINAFEIHGRTNTHADCPDEVFYGDVENFTTPTGLLLATGSTAGDSDLTAIAAGEYGSFDLDVSGYQFIDVYAKTASGTALLKCFWGLQ